MLAATSKVCAIKKFEPRRMVPQPKQVSATPLTNSYQNKAKPAVIPRLFISNGGLWPLQRSAEKEVERTSLEKKF
jgi:hypothetical protein